ncbi:PDC sensor domain-containing protein [Aestuariispira insulae]|uniref:Cache domain-containing protein n=1 Tax=Aestuariispira insulae TaxID=1461337 RepID=A0A3D9H7J3_9PROT|nr:cache domain-containing protein [Aestuariispira insulae]RED45121.1 cache domain-containing protein [Aestuariispira insulae]
MTVNKRLVLPLVLITLSAAFYGGMVFYTEQTTTNARAEAEMVYQSLRDSVASQVRQSERHLRELAEDPGVLTADPRKCGKPLAEMLERHRKIHDVFLRVRADGILDCTPKGGSEGIDFSERLYYRKAVETKEFVIGEFLIGKVSKEPVLAVSLPVLDANGEVAMVLAAGLKTDWLQDIIEQHTPSRNLVVEIEDSRGTLMSYFIHGQSVEPGSDAKLELIRLPLFPGQSDAQVVIYEQT